MARTLVIGASGGIGSAVASAAAERGDEVTGLSRSGDGLDITDPDSVDRIVGRLSGTFDLVLVATGALVVDGYQPEKSVRALEAEGLMGQFRVNTIGPALILKHVLRLLPRDRRSVFAALSARVGSIGDNRLGGWHSYRASKAALNQIVHGAAIEVARTHKQAVCVCLHPGTVETPFTAEYADRHDTVPADEAAANLLNVIESLKPDQTGKFFDYAGREIPW
ncbi:SDR family NAD(P)-dependent oxidoreductase [Amaricoccus tamworthensis]|uniref:SDR family NAD(P)-dependent oxidoreductase n=1 Tax=Amaricoccus tamworthensis TaxID=57002 RepID=UPI003C7B9D41